MDIKVFSNSYFCFMKFSEKYRQLSSAKSVQEIVVRDVYSTMALENQTVSRKILSRLVLKLLKLRSAK